MPVDFTPIGEKVSKRAARYDVVLIVAPLVDALGRRDAYRVLGVRYVEVYPLLPNDAPTLFSLLGLVAWLNERAREYNVLVEGCGGEALVRGAYQVVEGTWSWDDIKKLAGILQSPLHLRSLIHLAKMSEAGIDLHKEARRHIDAAFAGGDAYMSSILEHSIDLVVQLGLEDMCIREAYSYVISKPGRPHPHCLDVLETAKRLDYMKAGAVKTVAIDLSESGAHVLLGCRLLLRDDECWPEARNAEKQLEKLLMLRGYSLDGISLVDPEEAACIAYGLSYGYDCGV